MSRPSLAATLLASRFRRERDPDKGEAGASAGQVLVLFALMLTALMGILGLSVDVGYAVSQRRAMQNAADLAAIAGAHAVADYPYSDRGPSASTSVQTVVDGNQTREGSPAVESCEYVNDALAPVPSNANCDFAVPADATGVRVATTETHDTFFIRLVPGAPSQVTTGAHATARVELLFRAGMDSPFVVCGYGSKRVENHAYVDDVDILLDDGTTNPDAIGKTFRIVGDNVARIADADGDGLTDAKETRLGTSSLLTDADRDSVPDGRDSDRDGVPDGVEVATGKNPLRSDVPDLDRDDDGLTDAQEDANGNGVVDAGETNPNLWDTDDGKISDWAEVVVYHTDPTDKADEDKKEKDDKDGDGLSNDDEDARGTDRRKRDSDRGGTPDGLEVARGTDPRDVAFADRDDDWDTDGDGLTDPDEASVYGTDKLVWDTDGGGVSDWAEAVANATGPLEPIDDLGTGVDEIGNCGMTIVDDINDAASVSETTKDYKTYNTNANRAWNGFAHNKKSDSPNNDDRGIIPPSDDDPGNDVWNGRKGRSAPATQRFTVDGVDGCYGSNQAGNPDGRPAVNANNFSSDIDSNCILAIPIATTTTAPWCQMTGSAGLPCKFTVVKILAFKVARINSTNYEARLLDDYPTFGGSFPGWQRDAGGVVVIKLKDDE